MKTLRLLILLMAVGIAAACSSTKWDELPEPVAKFVARYFPQQGIESYGYNNDIYHVKVKDGAGLSFNNDYQWITVNGYGAVLPEMFLFDELPPALYAYLQETEQLDDVYAVTRTPSAYYVTLLQQYITYDIPSGSITGQM